MKRPNMFCSRYRSKANTHTLSRCVAPQQTLLELDIKHGTAQTIARGDALFAGLETFAMRVVWEGGLHHSRTTTLTLSYGACACSSTAT